MWPQAIVYRLSNNVNPFAILKAWTDYSIGKKRQFLINMAQNYVVLLRLGYSPWDGWGSIVTDIRHSAIFLTNMNAL